MSTRPATAAQSLQAHPAVVINPHPERREKPGPRGMRRRWRRILSGLALATLTACGGGQRVTTTGGAGEGPPKPEAGPTLPAPGRFLTEGRPTFSGDATLPPLDAERRVGVALGRALVPPPALDCTAREYAARFAADGEVPGPATVRRLAAHCGLWVQPAFTHAVSGADPEKVTEYLKALIEQRGLQGVGLGVVDGPGDQITAAVLTLPGDLRLDPLPRTVKPGQTVEIAGRLFRGRGPIRAFAAPLGPLADGVRPVELNMGQDGAFSLRWTVPPEAFSQGRDHVHIELLREEGRFLKPLGLVELRQRLPDGYPTSPGPGHAGAVDAGAFREAMLDALGRRRGEVKLKPLKPASHLSPLLDDWLSRLGKGQALEAPGVTDATGHPYATVRYTFAAGPDGAQAVALLLDRPHGQRALLSKEDEAVAIGVRPFPGGGGADAIIVTLSKFAPVGIPQARATITEALNQGRGARGLPPLQIHAGLEAAAQKVAEDALFGQTPWPEVIDAAMAGAGPAGASGAVGAGAFTLDKPEGANFASEPNAMAPQVKHVGIGVASGPLPGGGPPKYIVIYLVSEALAER